MQEQDSNLRPSGYEPDELPTALSCDINYNNNKSEIFCQEKRKNSNNNIKNIYYNKTKYTMYSTQLKVHNIKNNLKSVTDNIRKIALQCNRDPNDIALMTVSKGYPIEVIAEAYEHMQVLFGENRVQEASSKFDNYDSMRKNIALHLIGTLQKNKIAKALRIFDCIQSIDSISLICEIKNTILNSTIAPDISVPYPIFLQIRSSDSDFKHGFDTYDALAEAVEKVLSIDLLELRGIMTIAPFNPDERIVRTAFVKTRNFRDNIMQEFKSQISCLLLSMGMSGDYRLAIEEGTNLIRIGNAIFGVK